MTPPPPPPPPFRFTRRGTTGRPDPALDDADLAAARDALAQGRWTDSRTLLAETGDDWDRRGHRLVVLADARGSLAWAREWQQTEPESTDAAALTACAAAVAAARGREKPTMAREAVAAAAGRNPQDPTPWLAALHLARHTGTAAESRRAFEEVRLRHREHHHAHHLLAAVLADTANTAELYDFAQDSAGRAPADSPLALLPVIAHAERFRAECAGARTVTTAVEEHWSGRHAAHLVRSAFDWWLEWGSEEGHPRRAVDLNFLTYAKFHEGRLAEAAALFQRIDALVTPAPWSYSGREAYQAFRAARDAAYGAA
jgi:hypothetical protein